MPTSGVMLSRVALAVVRLIEERDKAVRLNAALAERCHGQSGLGRVAD